MYSIYCIYTKIIKLIKIQKRVRKKNYQAKIGKEINFFLFLRKEGKVLSKKKKKIFLLFSSACF